MAPTVTGTRRMALVDGSCPAQGCEGQVDPSPAPSSSGNSWNQGLSKSASARMAFFGVGVILAVFIISFGAWYIYRWRKRLSIFPCCGPRSIPGGVRETHSRNEVRVGERSLVSQTSQETRVGLVDEVEEVKWRPIGDELVRSFLADWLIVIFLTFALYYQPPKAIPLQVNVMREVHHSAPPSPISPPPSPIRQPPAARLAP